jgi:hypothetical protein
VPQSRAHLLLDSAHSILTLHPRVPDACESAAGDHVRSARVLRHRSLRASAGPRWSGSTSSELIAQDAPEGHRGERPRASELRRRGKFVPDALQQARRAEPQFLHPGTPADSTRVPRVGAVRECRSFSDPALAMSARAAHARGLPARLRAFGLNVIEDYVLRVRAAASSEMKKSCRRRAHQLAGAGASAVRASRGRLMRGTAPAGSARASAGLGAHAPPCPRSPRSRQARATPRDFAEVRPFPFSLPLPGARRSRAPVLSVLSVLLPGASVPARVGRGAQLVEHRRRSRAEEFARAVPGLQFREHARSSSRAPHAPGALAERSEALST